MQRNALEHATAESAAVFRGDDAEASNGNRSIQYSLWGLNPRPMAHKTIALTTELRELDGHKQVGTCGGKCWQVVVAGGGGSRWWTD